jgi:stearoyl-CoA desaturase (delta-9 desaturase)
VISPQSPVPRTEFRRCGYLSVGVTLSHRIVNLIGVFLPLAGFVAAIVFLWNEVVGWHDIAIMTVLYLLTGIGITVGFHRLFTHKAFKTYRPIQYAFAVLGTMAVEGSVTKWVADHRKHHAHTDVDGDPHSPHLAGGGVWGALKGLYHAHVGWLFQSVGQADVTRYARDMIEDRGLRIISKLNFVLIGASFALPFLLGWALTWSLEGALTALLWGGLVRVFLLHHITWSINSVCHFFGRRRFDVEDESRNVFWLAPISFGESWHHNHHAFPRSAFHGLRWWEVDPGGLVIRALERMRLAWDVVKISPERQRAKALT